MEVSFIYMKRNPRDQTDKGEPLDRNKIPIKLDSKWVLTVGKGVEWNENYK
jgi:hypothetical protein